MAVDGRRAHPCHYSERGAHFLRFTSDVVVGQYALYRYTHGVTRCINRADAECGAVVTACQRLLFFFSKSQTYRRKSDWCAVPAYLCTMWSPSWTSEDERSDEGSHLRCSPTRLFVLLLCLMMETKWGKQLQNMQTTKMYQSLSCLGYNYFFATRQINIFVKFNI